MNDSFDYLDRRLLPQRKWHSAKSKWNKQRFYCVEIVTLVAGAGIPIVNVWAVDDPYWTRVFSALFGGVVVLAVALGKLFKFQENWLQCRTLVEAFDRETELYRMSLGEYRGAVPADRDGILVERIEGLLSTTTASYISSHRGEQSPPKPL